MTHLTLASEHASAVALHWSGRPARHVNLSYERSHPLAAQSETFAREHMHKHTHASVYIVRIHIYTYTHTCISRCMCIYLHKHAHTEHLEEKDSEASKTITEISCGATVNQCEFFHAGPEQLAHGII